MPDKLQANLETIIQAALEPEGAEAPLRAAIEELPTINSRRGDILEQIKIRKDRQGDVVRATSLKLPNLRFNLGQFLFETIGAGLSISGSLEQPLLLMLTGIKFLRSALSLATVQISREDAELLIALYRLTREEEIVTVDQLAAVLVPGEMPEGKLASALERLERLGCISLTMGEVQLNETIVIHQRDEHFKGGPTEG